jgi:hypothetical protein
MVKIKLGGAIAKSANDVFVGSRGRGVGFVLK